MLFTLTVIYEQIKIQDIKSAINAVHKKCETVRISEHSHFWVFFNFGSKNEQILDLSDPSESINVLFIDRKKKTGAGLNLYHW